jgi:ribosomal protein S18 acetylase RimI-like enzyme
MLGLLIAPWHAGVVEIRWARARDEAALKQIDMATWTSEVSPAPPRGPDASFFNERTRPDEVLIAEVDGQVAGFAALGQTVPIPSHRHVLEIRGLAVDPAHQHRGVGRRLVEACVAQARQQGARKLTLRVLGFNDRARRLYESCGFYVEGLLRDEFFLDGRFVDDVLMAQSLVAEDTGARGG